MTSCTRIMIHVMAAPRLALLCLVLCFAAQTLAERTRHISVVKARDGGFQVVEGRHPEAVVNGSFSNKINETGYVATQYTTCKHTQGALLAL